MFNELMHVCLGFHNYFLRTQTEYWGCMGSMSCPEDLRFDNASVVLSV